ncbi:MAG TPA: MFS transporter [Polyangiaceae bacterium]|nr:MFS transporter [Polyangiaceae bacterium]
MLGLSRYQWLVLLAAWLGWGFDVFDGLLFNYVSPLCVPNLLGLDAHDPATKPVIVFWTGALTSLLLVGWGVGGLLFGKLTDRIGRTRTLLFTMITYALATALCAMAPNIFVLGALRFVAALGIGGEWAAGAALVAESVPEAQRVLCGALLYTSAPAGLFLATFVNDLFTRQLDFLAKDPSLSWRVVFLTGLIPALIALGIRWRVKEPAVFQVGTAKPQIRELFSQDLRRRTVSGVSMAVIALVTWWSCNAFLPALAGFLADEAGRPKDRVWFITVATTCFNLGGLVGTLLTVPVALHFGRRKMFLGYFTASALVIWLTFGLPIAPVTRLYMMGLIGLAVFGIFGCFTFYLPELFPARLRGTGAGFCYNCGRFVTACFPFLVSVLVSHGNNPFEVVKWNAIFPVIGIALVVLGVTVETKGQILPSGA